MISLLIAVAASTLALPPDSSCRGNVRAFIEAMDRVYQSGYKDVSSGTIDTIALARWAGLVAAVRSPVSLCTANQPPEFPWRRMIANYERLQTLASVERRSDLTLLARIEGGSELVITRAGAGSVPDTRSQRPDTVRLHAEDGLAKDSIKNRCGGHDQPPDDGQSNIVERISSLISDCARQVGVRTLDHVAALRDSIFAFEYLTQSSERPRAADTISAQFSDNSRIRAALIAEPTDRWQDDLRSSQRDFEVDREQIESALDTRPVIIPVLTTETPSRLGGGGVFRVGTPTWVTDHPLVLSASTYQSGSLGRQAWEAAAGTFAGHIILLGGVAARRAAPTFATVAAAIYAPYAGAPAIGLRFSSTDGLGATIGLALPWLSANNRQ